MQTFFLNNYEFVFVSKIYVSHFLYLTYFKDWIVLINIVAWQVDIVNSQIFL